MSGTNLEGKTSGTIKQDFGFGNLAVGMPDRLSMTVSERLHHKLKIRLNYSFFFIFSVSRIGLTVSLCLCGHIAARVGAVNLFTRPDGRAKDRVRPVSITHRKRCLQFRRMVKRVIIET